METLRFDIIVIGAGHAGVEAACAAARMGAQVALVTLERAAVARLSCNPAIGGQAKGQIVREIDALGGVMGLAADGAGIQFRMLNTSKGPAVRSPRSQQDRPLYTEWMLAYLQGQKRVALVEGMATALTCDDRGVTGVALEDGRHLAARAVVLCSGTFLDGLMHVGLESVEGGRFGERSVRGLTPSLEALGLTVGRLKTGTPPRLHRDSIDYDRCAIQHGDDPPQPFSYMTDRLEVDQICCHLTWTNPQTHQIILDGLDRSPLYTGLIQGVGPRYCPSIEDKVVRFADRDRHQIFLEPEGRHIPDIYANGIPTSLARDTQEALVRSIVGLEQARILRYGYAVEYTFLPPSQLRATLETKAVPGLFCAGQINGTSGYEEAAGQGLVAGVNATLALRGEGEWVPGRHEAYIGVMIDDLVTRGVTEPYRMFTSRAEHRLVLRQDNADLRLTETGRALGLVDDQRYARFLRYRDALEAERARLETTRLRPAQISDAFLEATGMARAEQGYSLAQLLARGGVEYAHLDLLAPAEAPVSDRAREQVAIQIKYAGYIERQVALIQRQNQWETLRLPEDMDYHAVRALSREAQVRLNQTRPRTVGQAGRVSGVTPSDMEVLCIHLRARPAAKPEGYGNGQ